MLLSGQEND